MRKQDGPLWFVVVLILGLMVGCGGGQPSATNGDGAADQTQDARAQPLSGEVRMAGSSTVYPISTAVAEEFRREHTGVSVPVSSTGTGGGFSNFFCRGKTDINNASRPIKDSERELCQKNGVEPLEFQIATDAVTVVVNPGADWVQCVTVRELRRIWRPENPAKKWKDVRPAWPDKKLELYGAASTSGTFDYFTEAIMGEEDAQRSDYQATEHDNTIVQAVSGSKYAMGYFGFAYYSQNQSRVKALGVDDENGGEGCVKPSLETAQDGTYRPLSRPLYIYVDKNSLERKEVYEFVKFYLKQSASDLVASIGYVPVKENLMYQNIGELQSL